MKLPTENAAAIALIPSTFNPFSTSTNIMEKEFTAM